MMIAAAIAKPMRKAMGDKNVDLIGVDSFDKNGVDKDGIDKLKATLDENGWSNNRPTILVGYTPQLAKAIECDDKGIPYLNGRRVHCIVNDRLTLNIDALQEPQGRKLDPNTFIASNRSYIPGGDKGAAYQLANEFNNTAKAEFPEFSEEIDNDQAWDLKAVYDLVVEKVKNGGNAIIKPSGTGHGDGVLPFFAMEYDSSKDFQDQIWNQIQKSFNGVKAVYEDRGGFPYTVSKYHIADRINAPDSRYHTMKYEYRIPVFADYSGDEPRLVANPSIIKIDGGSKLASGQDGRFSKEIASVSTQVQRTGLPASEFMKPLCNKETMDLIGLDEAHLTKLCQWATRYAQYVLENVDAIGSVSATAQRKADYAASKGDAV